MATIICYDNVPISLIDKNAKSFSATCSCIQDIVTFATANFRDKRVFTHNIPSQEKNGQLMKLLIDKQIHIQHIECGCSFERYTPKRLSLNNVFLIDSKKGTVQYIMNNY